MSINEFLCSVSGLPVDSQPVDTVLHSVRSSSESLSRLSDDVHFLVVCLKLFLFVTVVLPILGFLLVVLIHVFLP